MNFHNLNFINLHKMRKKMKKSIIYLLAVSAIIILSSGCASVQNRKVMAITKSTAFNATNVVTPLVEPQIEVKTRITGHAECWYLFCIFPMQETVSMKGGSYLWWLFPPFAQWVRDAATKDAFESTKADVLIAPTYTVKEKWYLLWSEYTATVTGYAGKYTSFKQMSIKEQIDLGILNTDVNIRELTPTAEIKITK
jgi:hypothetical protein